MTHPDHIRKKAIQMRVERNLTIDQIAERLAISRTTIYYWVRDLPLPEYSTPARKLAQIRASEATVAKWQQYRDDAYALGLVEWEDLVRVPTFREFVALYIAEGLKRSRNCVSIANSDPRMLALAVSWLRRLTDRELTYSIQYHADQDLQELRRFWGDALNIDGSLIRFQRKSDSSQLTGRTWRSIHGVLTVTINDTWLRSRLQAWIDRIRETWTLESVGNLGV